MPTSSTVVRSLALAALGFGAASVQAQAQTANVTAFNPYNGVGLPGPAAAPAPAPRRGLPMVEQAVPMAGPAFNPWQQGPAVGWTPAAPQGQAPVYSEYYSRGANLPPPPPGPIESRVVAIPQRGDPPGSPRVLTPAPAPTPPPAPVATPQVEPAPRPPEPVPIPRQAEPTRAAPPAAPPPVATVAPPPPPAATVAPPPPPPPAATAVAPPPPVATVAPPPPPPRSEPTMPPPSTALTVATVTFAGQSAEISDAAKADLNRVAKNLTGVRQIEVRAYASGSDPVESRKIALARALVVRSYLIDQNVKTRIEISGASGGGERVDIMTSN